MNVPAWPGAMRGFAPKVNLRLMVRQAHHERKYENPFALSLSKGDLAKQGTFGAKLQCVKTITTVVLTTSELSLHRCPAVKARRMATPSNSGHSAHGS